MVRKFLHTDSYDQAGRPKHVGELVDLTAFGTRHAREDVTLASQPYFPYIDRPESGQVGYAIDAALDETSAPESSSSPVRQPQGNPDLPVT